jgi:hypothetical protein
VHLSVTLFLSLVLSLFLCLCLSLVISFALHRWDKVGLVSQILDPPPFAILDPKDVDTWCCLKYLTNWCRYLTPIFRILDSWNAILDPLFFKYLTMNL